MIPVDMLLCIMSVTKFDVSLEVERARRYLEEALGVQTTPAPWRGGNRLPQLLTGQYEFVEIELLGVPCLLMLDTRQIERSPATLRKHMELLETKWRGHVVYVRPQVAAFNRRRLIEQKVPFIVPGNQMYLPMMGIDLREHFRSLRTEPATVSPATQVLIIHSLLRDIKDTATPKTLAKQLGYSAMTLTRVFDELEATQLAEISTVGRERRLRWNQDKRAIWKKAEPLLRSPVTQRLHIARLEAEFPRIQAGLSALARYTMIAPPTHTVFALGRDVWKTMRRLEKPVQLPEPDTRSFELEIWSYRPALLADDDTVDALSLYLSLKDNPDERIEAALEELMRKLPW